MGKKYADALKLIEADKFYSPKEAVELVKELYIDLLLGIEIDEENGYIYVSTMYPISKRKIKNKLYSLMKCRGWILLAQIFL